MSYLGIRHKRWTVFSVLSVALAVSALLLPAYLFASDGPPEHGKVDIPATFLWIAAILLLAKVSSLIERVGQPAVLGELLMGVFLGSLAVAGITAFEPIKTNEIIHFLAELGVVILLFQIGMESSVRTMMKVGVPSFLVACVGVILPMVLISYVVGPWLIPGLAASAYLFLGATMTATSVGITARVLKDIGRSDTPEARIIIGAAVIDDVLGLIILAVVTAIVTTGSVGAGTVSFIILKAVLFLGGGVLLGTWLAPRLSRFFSRIHTGIGMKFAVVISFGLVFAYLASLVGLAPIVGAFTAGLILTPVYFDQFSDPPLVQDLRDVVREHNMEGQFAEGPFAEKLDGVLKKHSHRHIEEFAEHLGHFMVPIFFVLTGMQVKIASLFDTTIILTTAGIFIAALLTKVAAGWAAGKGRHHLAVGIGMIPRGEVGLIFANMGKDMGVMSDAVFSSIVVVIMLTTLITPPMLTAVFKKRAAGGAP